MKPTVELYYEDAYISEFNSIVVNITPSDKKGENLYDVILDQTAFFPEGGGQAPDTGILGTGKVIDVHKDKEGIITHTVSFPGEVPTDGDIIIGKIDFDRRFIFMQHHTGEHIFTGLVHKRFGYDNVGFHLSDHVETMDFSGPITKEEIRELEIEANRVVAQNIPVRAYFPNNEELKNLEYRAKLDAEAMGNIRIIDIEGVDTCACCAPHLSSTGQVGIIKIVEAIKHKNGVRLTAVCGLTAFMDYMEKHNILTELSRSLSVPASGVLSAFNKLRTDMEEQREYIKSLESIIIDSDIRNGINIHSEALGISSAICVFTNVTDKILFRNAANSQMDEGNTILLFKGNDTSGYSFIFASKKDDVVSLLHHLSESIDIKGGGKNPMVQGSTNSPKEEILRSLGVDPS